MRRLDAKVVVDTVVARIERRFDIIVKADSFGRPPRTRTRSVSPNALRGRVTSNNRLVNICLACNLPRTGLHREEPLSIREVTDQFIGLQMRRVHLLDELSCVM
jgi:hypothetical protein